MRIEIFGDRSKSDVVSYLNALGVQCTALGIQLNTTAAGQGLSADLNLVFAPVSTGWTAQDEQTLQQLVAQSQLILPVIDSAPDAVRLPAAVKSVNAFKKSDMGSAWIDGLVDETLGMAWLKRRARKVFISYRRMDSAPIANQLFERFSHLGYEAFLDDASIDRGVDFQRELLWWLNDADLLLMLASPRFSDSVWCMKEISFAQSHTIGIAAVEWPSAVYGPGATVRFGPQLGWLEPRLLQATMPDQRWRLKLGDFEGLDGDKPDPDPDLPARELTAAAVEQVLAQCARHRAQAIRARLNELVPLVRDTLTRENATALTQHLGDLTYCNASGQDCFVRVLPFRPHPEHIQEAYQAGGGKFLAACAYPESDVTDTRARALRWLAQKDHSPRPPGLSNSALWAFCGDVRI